MSRVSGQYRSCGGKEQSEIGISILDSHLDLVMHVINSLTTRLEEPRKMRHWSSR